MSERQWQVAPGVYITEQSERDWQVTVGVYLSETIAEVPPAGGFFSRRYYDNLLSGSAL